MSYAQGQTTGEAHAKFDAERSLEHAQNAAKLLHLGEGSDDWNDFMQGYGYGFAKRKREMQETMETTEETNTQTSCSWCTCDIDDPADAIIAGTDAETGEDRVWCGECEEGMNDSECVA
jgi:hypothetical protein